MATARLPYELKFEEIIDDTVQWKQCLPGKTAEGSFHEHYWGQAIETEAADWRHRNNFDTAPHSPAPGLVDQTRSTKELLQDLEGDDLLPECFLLHNDEGGVLVQDIWVRAEYIRVYDQIIALYKNYRRKRRSAVVVTGQPGIGKSLGRFYLLRRLIGERLPVFWVRSGHIYLFAKDGVWGIRAESFSSKSLYTVFAIADAFDHKYVEKLLGDIHTLLVYHSFPHEEIWTGWSALRDTPPLVITMNPWQRVELLRALRYCHPDSQSSDEKLNQVFDEYGPVMRVVEWAVTDQHALDTYKNLVSKKLDMFGVYLTRRQHSDVLTDGVGTPYFLHPISLHVEEELRKTRSRLDVIHRLDLYRDHALLNFAQAVCGEYFEDYCHRALWSFSIEINAMPMIRHESDALAPRQHDFRSCHFPFIHSRNGTLNNIRDMTETVLISFRASRPNLTPSPSLDDLHIVDNVYYMPKDRNYPTIDSLILVDGNLYLFQFTIAKKHPINPAIIGFLQRAVKQYTKVVFIFVVPEEMEHFTCPYPSDPGLRELLIEGSLHLVSARVFTKSVLEQDVRDYALKWHSCPAKELVTTGAEDESDGESESPKKRKSEGQLGSRSSPCIKTRESTASKHPRRQPV